VERQRRSGAALEPNRLELAMKMPCKLFAATVMALGASSFAAPVDAAPITAPSSLRNAAPPSVETVQWRRGWRGWGPAFATGAIVGGAIAASRPWYGYGYYYDYAYAPGYAYGYGYDYDPGYAYAPGYTAGAPGYTAGDSVAYCQQRFRSYDPATGTYLGYDGLRHPCP
jgi:hypothetical protein